MWSYPAPWFKYMLSSAYRNGVLSIMFLIHFVVHLGLPFYLIFNTRCCTCDSLEEGGEKKPTYLHQYGCANEVSGRSWKISFFFLMRRPFVLRNWDCAVMGQLLEGETPQTWSRWQNLHSWACSSGSSCREEVSHTCPIRVSSASKSLAEKETNKKTPYLTWQYFLLSAPFP